MSIKNLYIAYNFFKDGYKWLSKEEMIYEHYDDNVPITIEFLSYEEWIIRKYYENGNIHLETSYKNNKMHGYERCYYYDKNIKFETLYKNNKLHGLERYYDRSGIVYLEILYKNGNLCGTRLYDAGANIKEEIFN